MLGDENHLPHVVSIVPELAVDRLHHRVRFASNERRPAEITVCQRREGVERVFPTRFPERQQLSPGWRRRFELRIAIAVGLLAVGLEEISSARPHVAGEVLHDDRDGIGLRVQCGEQRFVRRLRDSAIA